MSQGRARKVTVSRTPRSSIEGRARHAEAPRRDGERRGAGGRYALDDDEDEELLLEALDSDDSELALDALDSELALDRLEDEESGSVGLPLLQPPRAPTPASAAPPDSRIRNSRRSGRGTSSEAGSGTPSLFSVMTPLPQGVEVFPVQLLRGDTALI
jgi:hypothetical protein